MIPQDNIRQWSVDLAEWKRNFILGVNKANLDVIYDYDLVIYSFRTGPIVADDMRAALKSAGWEYHKKDNGHHIWSRRG